ncbi:MAG TPA: HAMP domain-containing sensor histidine kinase, partial [Bacillota bacterium]
EKLLDELLEFSRMESDGFQLQLAETNLAELAREILIEYLPFIKEQDINLQADIPDSPVSARVDPNRISRVLRNLIDNALKYGSQGKYLRVAVTSTQTTISIEVEDRGPGITETEQAKIFDRFYRIDKGRNSAAGGAGLGLAIAREIVRKHGGQIRVTSEKGKGTIFGVELPATSTQESKPD